MPTAVDPTLAAMVAAFETNRHVETVIRRQQKRDLALIRLGDDVHARRVGLAREIREHLHRTCR